MATDDDEASGAREAANREDRRRMQYIAAALGVLLLGCIGLGIYAAINPDRDETFNFIALLIIFMTALAASSIIFVSLKMGSDQEAFGLPSGSVRALLAVGIMILFVVFGLPMVSPSDPKELSTGTVRVPAEQVDRLIELNSQQGFVVRVRDPGVAATPAPAPGAPAPRLASLEIVRLNSVSGEQWDLNKQMLTAIITLLTTVIGFYFGSRSATDRIRATADGDGEDSTPQDDSTRQDGSGSGGETSSPGASDTAAGTPAVPTGEPAADTPVTDDPAENEPAEATEATPEQFADGVNRQEADDLPDESRGTLPKLDPEEKPDGN
jgi:hypothetical protein